MGKQLHTNDSNSVINFMPLQNKHLFLSGKSSSMYRSNYRTVREKTREEGCECKRSQIQDPPWDMAAPLRRLLSMLDLDLGRSLQPAYLTLIFADLSSCSALIQRHHDNVKTKMNWFVNHKW